MEQELVTSNVDAARLRNSQCKHMDCDVSSNGETNEARP